MSRPNETGILSRRRVLRATLMAGAGAIGSGLLAACGGAAAVGTITTSGAISASTTPITSAAATTTTAGTTSALSTASGAATTSTVSTAGGAATTSASGTGTSATSTAAATSVRAATTVVPKAGTVNFYAYVSNPAETGQWNGYAKQYMATHPGTQVAVSGTGSDYWTKLSTMMAGGAPPDVVQLYSLVFAPFAAKGTLLDLSPYIARDKYDLSDFYPVSYEAFNWKGTKLGLSTDLYLVGFYYVPDLFAAAGVKEPDNTWTWENVREAAQKLTKPDKSQFGIRLANDYSRWATVVWDYGAEFFERKDDPRKANFLQQPIIDGVSLWADMINKDHSSPTDAELAANKQLYFWFGTMGMDVVDGPTILSLVKKSKADLKWAVAPYPKGPGGANTTGAFPDGLEIPKGTKEADGAWNLLKYFVSAEFLTTFAADTGRMPSRKSLAEGAAYQKAFTDAGVQHADQLPAAATDAATLANSGANDQIRALANKEMQQSWAGTRAVKDSLQAIQQQVQPLLDALPQ